MDVGASSVAQKNANDELSRQLRLQSP
jgi:hypothetical protein